jgi:hypothetical protein
MTNRTIEALPTCAAAGRKNAQLRQQICGIVLTLTIAAAPASVRGQQTPADRSDAQRMGQSPTQLMVAPNAPHAEMDLRAPSGGGDRTANICLELQAFLDQAQGSGGTDAQNFDQKGAPPQEQLTTQSAAAQPDHVPNQGGQASGPATTPRPPEQESAIVDLPQRNSGLSARVPHDGTAVKAPFVSLDQVRAYVSANGLLACQEAVRRMRRAGVALPNGLLALAALRPDMLQGPP